MKKRVAAAFLVLAMAFSLVGCQSKEAKAVDAAIAAIGTVTLESKDAIETARAAYDSLSGEDRESLKNTEALFEAEESLLILEVIDMIDRLPHINLNHKAKLDDIAGQYDRISPERQAEVTNYEKLQKAYDTWYAIAYGVAEGLYEEEDLEAALEYYVQLPKGYEEADARIAEIKPKIELANARKALYKTWVWDGEYAAASDGNSYPADFRTITFSEDDSSFNTYSIYGSLFSMKVETSTVESDLLAKGALSSYYPGCIEKLKSNTASNHDSSVSIFDDAGNLIPSEQWATLPVPENEYAVVQGGPYMNLTNSYQLQRYCKIEYHFQKDGKMRVEYYLRDLTGGTERNAHMSFYYTEE